MEWALLLFQGKKTGKSSEIPKILLLWQGRDAQFPPHITPRIHLALDQEFVLPFIQFSFSLPKLLPSKARPIGLQNIPLPLDLIFGNRMGANEHFPEIQSEFPALKFPAAPLK